MNKLSTRIARCGTLARVVAAVGALAVAAGAQPVTQPATAPALDPARAQRPLAEIPALPDFAARAVRPAEEDAAARAHYENALERMGEQDYEQVVKELEAALRLVQGDAYDMLLLLAQAEQHRGRFGAARLAAEHAALYRTDDPAPQEFLGALCRQQNRLDEAVAHYAAAAQAGAARPDNPRASRAWYALGECLLQAGYLRAAAEAFAEFDRCVWAAHPEQRSAPMLAAVLAEYPHGLIARRLELLGQVRLPAEQAAAARWALGNRPEDPYIQRLYVRTLLDIGQAAEAFDYARAHLGEPVASAPATVHAGGPALLTLALEAARAAGRLDAWRAELTKDVAAGGDMALALRVAQALDETGAARDAVPLWRVLAAAQPESTDCAWGLAAALKNSGDLSGALDALIALVRRNPDADIAPQRLADWMRSFAATDEFLRLVTARTARPDCDFVTYTVLGATAAAAGQAELASRLFESALEQRPDFALAHVAWGRMLVGEYRWAEAQAQARAALARAPQLVAAQLVLGDACAGLDENEAAEAAYKAAVEQRPNDVDAVAVLAQHYQRMGNRLAAQRWLQQAWSLGHVRPEVLEDLIESYLAAGKLELARACLEQAEAADLPADALRRMRTTVRYAAPQRPAEFLAELQRQFAAAPTDVRTGLKLATGLELANRPDEAFGVLQQLAAHGPAEEQATYLLGRVQMSRLEMGEAIRVLEEMARRYPRRPTTLSLLAEAYLADFRLPEARATLQRILSLDLDRERQVTQRLQLLASYEDFMEYDAAAGLIETWLAEEPPASAPAGSAQPADTDETAEAERADLWPRAKLRVLLRAGRREDAVQYAVQRLTTATAEYEAAVAAYKAVAEPLRAARGADRELQVSLKAREQALAAAIQTMLTRRAEFVQVCIDAKQPERAEADVKTWLAEQPDQAQNQEWTIALLLAQKKPEQALRIVAALVPKTAAEAAKVITLRARCNAAAGKTDDAVRDLTLLLSDAFVSAAPGLALAARQEIVSTLVSAQDYTQALKLCDAWLSELDSQPLVRTGVLMLKRLVLSAAEREEDHIAVAEELLKLQPNDPGLNNDLGYTWVERGEQLERALALIRKAVAAAPLNSAYLDSLGWAYYKRGDFATARLYLARAVRLETGQEAVEFDHLADAEYRAGDVAAAREHWQKALQLAEEDTQERAGPRTALLAAVRGKIAALAAGAPPAVAPLGAGVKEEP
jgi:tetratricopeptide (TPR) repeat protein